jgi:glutamine synthetase
VSHAAKELGAQGVLIVRVLYPDIHGIARSKDVPTGLFAEACERGIGFCAASLANGLAFDLGNPVRDSGAYPDMRIYPVEATLAQLPWDASIAWCLGSVAKESGADPSPPPLSRGERGAVEHSLRSTRSLLARATQAYESIGLSVIAAAELEFYLLRQKGDGRVEPLENEPAMFYTTGDRADPSGVVRLCRRYGNAMGLEITTAHHECGRGQYEINLNHGPALAAADRAFLFKYMVKEVAARQELAATFMGKPFAREAGSGFHLYVSLQDEKGNGLCDEKCDDGLSDLAKHFVAGILAHAPALTAFNCPTVNAYKRLVHGMLAPLAADWGLDNRAAYIRIPDERGPATRLELRGADGAANPYLILAANLLAGLDGIQRRLVPPPAAVCPPHPALSPQRGERGMMDRLARGEKGMMDQTARGERGVVGQVQSGMGGVQPSSENGNGLPMRLEEALEALERDEWLKSAIGEPLVADFVAIKLAEAERFRAHVTDWEIKEYAWHL